MISLLLTLINLSPAQADNITYPTTFIPGQQLPASQLNGNFSAVSTVVNGNLTDGNIKAGAAIAPSKINFGSILSANQVLGENAGATAVEGKTVTPGTAISVTPSTGALTIANTGVTSNVAGTGIGVSGATGAVTVSNTGVTSALAGTGIGVSGATGAVTVSNTGVTSNLAGTGISVSGATGAVTIGNTGVTSIVAGSGISVSGSTGAVTINAANSNIGYAKVTLTPTQINGMSASPVTLVSGSTGQVLIPISWGLFYTYTGSAFASGGPIYVGPASSGGGVLQSSTTLAAAVLANTGNAGQWGYGLSNVADASGINFSAILGQPLSITNSSGAFTGGSGASVDVWVQYYAVTP